MTKHDIFEHLWTMKKCVKMFRLFATPWGSQDDLRPAKAQRCFSRAGACIAAAELTWTGEPRRGEPVERWTWEIWEIWEMAWNNLEHPNFMGSQAVERQRDMQIQPSSLVEKHGRKSKKEQVPCFFLRNVPKEAFKSSWTLAVLMCRMNCKKTIHKSYRRSLRWTCSTFGSPSFCPFVLPLLRSLLQASLSDNYSKCAGTA